MQSPVSTTLQIVYGNQGKIQLWQSGRTTDLVEYMGNPQYMDYEGFINTLPMLFSDDGAYIAFLQLDGGIWIVRPDGSDLKFIYNETDVDPAFERPYLINWLPGTHILLFSKIYWLATSLYSKSGTFYAANIDTGDVNKHEVFPNKGATFIPAPDGIHIAAVSGGELVVIEASGDNRKELHSFPWIKKPRLVTHSDSLIIVVSPNKLNKSSDSHFEIWQVFIDNRPLYNYPTFRLR